MPDMIVAEPQAAPLGIIERAIEKGVSAESMEKLVGLHLQLQRVEAEKSFNAALQAFQSECPPIAHDASGYKDEYGYASLPQIVKSIKPWLDKHKLLFSFDSETNGQTMLIKCIVYHVDGHSRTSTVQMAIQGTKMMNQPQMSASALTYGRRHALCAALGLVTADHDDDGRAAEPVGHPAPQRNESASKAAPRDQRVSKEELGALAKDWKDAIADPGLSKEDQRKEFAAFCEQVTRGAVKADKAFESASWDTFSVQEVRDAIARKGVPF